MLMVRKYWSQAKEKILNKISIRRNNYSYRWKPEEVHGLSDSTVMIHRSGWGLSVSQRESSKTARNNGYWRFRETWSWINWKSFGTEQTNEMIHQKNGLLWRPLCPLKTELLGKKVGGRIWRSVGYFRMKLQVTTFNTLGRFGCLRTQFNGIGRTRKSFIEIHHSETSSTDKIDVSILKDNPRKFDVNAMIARTTS